MSNWRGKSKFGRGRRRGRGERVALSVITDQRMTYWKKVDNLPVSL